MPVPKETRALSRDYSDDPDKFGDALFVGGDSEHRPVIRQYFLQVAIQGVILARLKG